MNETVARVIVAAVGAYVAIGVPFAAAFVTWGVSRIDRVAHGATIGFRLLLLPGAAALWPLLASRWLRSVK